METLFVGATLGVIAPIYFQGLLNLFVFMKVLFILKTHYYVKR